MIALHAAVQPDAFPAGDPGLRRAAGRLLETSCILAAGEIEELAESWRPHLALPAMELWMAA